MLIHVNPVITRVNRYLIWYQTWQCCQEPAVTALLRETLRK